ncbi:hypothetical protein Tco_0657002 [Tanacetum coccineum]|uniref:Uncharacterized protein n=1 Tax=Tanacetum coccineum TaxID=301880 RepID=A0ABQ4XAC7_9ASTR
MGHENGTLFGPYRLSNLGSYTKWKWSYINHHRYTRLNQGSASKDCRRDPSQEKERKARLHLLMALPEDHLAKFHKMTDAIKSRFGRNDESKKMQKYILKQQFEGFSVSKSEGLHKGYDSGPKPGVDSLSFDDLYNNLRVFENDVKGSTASSTSTQNVAFVSENTSSTNDVSTAYSVSNTSSQNSQYEQSSSYSLLANQSSCPQLDHEDLEQLDEYALEEMDLKWNQLVLIKPKSNATIATRQAILLENVEPREIKIIGEELLGTLEIRMGEDLIGPSHSEERRRLCFDGFQQPLVRHTREQLSDASIEIKTYTQGLKKVEAQLVAHQQGQLCFSHLIRDCDFHEKRMTKQAELNNNIRMKSSQREIRPIWNNVQRVNHQNPFVPTAVLTRTGKIPFNTARASGTKNVSTARHSFNRQAVLTSTAMKVNTVKPIVNRVRPTTVFHKTHSPFSKPFNKTTTLRTKFSKQKVNTAKMNAVSAIGGKRETTVKPSAGCNWRPKRHHYWQNVSKYNGGSNLRNCFTFKDPLGRLKPKQAGAHDLENKAYLAEYQGL